MVSYWNVRARDGYDGQSGQDAARALWAPRLGGLIAEEVGADARILDIGCGTGFLARLLAAQGHRVTGQDVSSGMLEVAAERAAREGLEIEFEIGSAEQPPGGPFDAVVLRNVVWTLPGPADALRALADVLRPGGCLLISDARWGAAEIGDESAARRFDDCYAEARRSLPLSDGVDFAGCVALVRDAGFDGIADHTELFDRVPYPSAPDFFLLSARVAGGDADDLAVVGGGVVGANE